MGVFSGNKMTADLEKRTVTLDGNARLRIDARKRANRRLMTAPALSSPRWPLLPLPRSLAAAARRRRAIIRTRRSISPRDHIELQDRANRVLLTAT